MEAEATCLLPKPSTSDEMSLVTEEREVWFSEMDGGGFALSYKADSNQITFLQMLSSKASQDIIYHCSNSVAYNHAKRGNKRKAVTLMSWNDLEIRHRGKFSYRATVDECQVRAKVQIEMLLSESYVAQQFPLRVIRAQELKPGACRSRWRIED